MIVEILLMISLLTLSTIWTIKKNCYVNVIKVESLLWNAFLLKCAGHLLSRHLKNSAILIFIALLICYQRAVKLWNAFLSQSTSFVQASQHFLFFYFSSWKQLINTDLDLRKVTLDHNTKQRTTKYIVCHAFLISVWHISLYLGIRRER